MTEFGDLVTSQVHNLSLFYGTLSSPFSGFLSLCLPTCGVLHLLQRLFVVWQSENFQHCKDVDGAVFGNGVIGAPFTEYEKSKACFTHLSAQIKPPLFS